MGRLQVRDRPRGRRPLSGVQAVTSDEIRQMFLDSADLGKMGPFDKEREATEARFAELSERYKTEYLSARSEPCQEKPIQPDWKAVLQYLAGVLRQMDAAVPETAPMNKAAWAVIAPAVQKFYEGEKTGKNEEPAE